MKNLENNIKDQMKNRDIILQNMSNDIKEIKEEQRNLSKSIAKIEIEHKTWRKTTNITRCGYFTRRKE